MGCGGAYRTCMLQWVNVHGLVDLEADILRNQALRVRERVDTCEREQVCITRRLLTISMHEGILSPVPTR